MRIGVIITILYQVPNNTFPSIKFTFEIENQEQLTFLDVLVIENYTSKLEIEIIREFIHTYIFLTSTFFSTFPRGVSE